jgi:DNA-directed RNA polymerase subunit RPC12/RpoP
MEVTCLNCGNKITNPNNIFEGFEPSYICPECRYEGYVRESELEQFYDEERIFKLF